MKRTTALIGLAVAILVLLPATALAAEVGYIEDFALAKDRAAALKQLIPGTEDYYYYHCLHYQNTAQLEKVGPMLEVWVKRYGSTPRAQEIQNRQALLTYAKGNDESLRFLIWRLGLTYSHQKETVGPQVDLPTKLDPALISIKTLMARELGNRPNEVSGFSDSGLELLLGSQISSGARRDLLRRLQRPDYENLPDLIVADMKWDNLPFGSLPIHYQLLRSQMDQLLKLRPDLINDSNFVCAYLTKLRPNPDVDWRHNVEARRAYLDRLWAFVSPLAPAFNSLKAHVLYQRLVLDRSQGQWDKDRFMAYVKLPRQCPYMLPAYLQSEDNRRWQASLEADFSKFTLYGIVGPDEPLVRSYLMHFLVNAEDSDEYAPYIESTYLRRLFAETKIVNGVGDMEKWYSMLTLGGKEPELYQALKDRIDVDFDYANKSLFAADEPVTLALHVKNVKDLLVKVYQVNAVNYYRTKLEEISTDIDLDGLMPNVQKPFKYDDVPLRRVRHTYDKDLATLKDPGVYVVEFIGNGRSSRALVQKGSLRELQRVGLAGHVFTILDDSNKKVTDARIFLGGREYAPDADGQITIPFTNKPGIEKIVVSSGDLATLSSFLHQAEQYTLQAGFHVDRESLLKRKKASVIVRPVLRINGNAAGLNVLEEVTLVISSLDREGVRSVKEVHDFKLSGDKESSYEFQVPENLLSISFALQAKVQSLSQNKKVDLSDSREFSLNSIDTTPCVEDLHLLHIAGKYFLDVLGKTGEPKADRSVTLQIKHKDFNDPVTVSLRSDKQGRIALGALERIDTVRATGPEGAEHVWYMVEDLHSYPACVHGQAGQAIHIPYMGTAREVSHERFSLLEVVPSFAARPREPRGDEPPAPLPVEAFDERAPIRADSTIYVADHLESLKLQDGFLVIQDLPRGDYRLLIKDTSTSVYLRLAEGKPGQGYILSDYRQLQVKDAAPLQIVGIDADKDAVKVQLANAGKTVRVHVVATRYMPAYPIYADLLALGMDEPLMSEVDPPESFYTSGRNIGDEYRYILDRKYAKKFPGNLLTRPGLLLNPWAIRKTETGVQEAITGEAPDKMLKQLAAKYPSALRLDGRRGRIMEQLSSNLDFLSQGSVVMVDLKPDKNGVVRIQRKDLGAHQQLCVLAVDSMSTVYREATLAELKMDNWDLRLGKKEALDPSKHFTEQKQITSLAKNEQLVIKDIGSSRFESQDSLRKVYTLYSALSKNPTLAEFAFVLDWPGMKMDQKREKYSKYACHELSFFLYKKDPEFFKQVIAPYLRNKKDKTFLDHYLVGDDLGAFAKPWAYAQLNAAERILLAQRIKGEGARTLRHVSDLYDLIPPDLERFDLLFRTALGTSGLETTDQYGYKAAHESELGPTTQPAEGIAAGGGMDAAPSEESAALRPGVAGRAPAGRRTDAQVTKGVANGKDRGGKEAEELAEDKEKSRDQLRRGEARQFYRKLDKTEEWVENNYYHLPIEDQNASLVKVNGFWRDYAKASAAEDGKPFLSTHLAEASGNFTEMMLAMALLDLPFEPAKSATSVKDSTFELKAGGPMIVFHKEIKPSTADAAQKTPILISQNYFQFNDRYRYDGNEKFDKYVTDEFLVSTVYGCQIVVTNPTSSPQKLSLLIQIPRGAMPVLNGLYTRSLLIDLGPYSTKAIEYAFYFPFVGEFPHYPVQVSRNEKYLTSVEPTTLKVVAKLSKIDRTSWDYISQNGSEQDVLRFLRDNNINRLNLDKIAWRVKGAEFFHAVIDLLKDRHVYSHTLWSYALKHNDVPAINEFLKNCNDFVAQCGLYIASPLLTIDPVIRKTYQHMEYSPLVNARAHKLGRQRTILNDRLAQQYDRLMRVLTYRGQLDKDDLMAVTYYLLLQDRVEEALDFFGRVEPKNLATRLQYDYFAAYIDFYTENLKDARAIASRYADFPVDRWRKLFANVTGQLDELEGKAVNVIDKEDRTQTQARLAATEPGLDLTVEARRITINYQNISQFRVNYYLIDVELLFSKSPFAQQYSGQFSFVRPYATAVVTLPAKEAKPKPDRADGPKGDSYTFDLPKEFHNGNVMIEIVAGGLRKSQAYYANSLALQVTEEYGQLKVASAKTGKPLPKAYVKTYARMKDGQVKFYKDGYTDLRGRFDYTSLNTNELEMVERFAILVMTEADGAVVKEANPPKQ